MPRNARVVAPGAPYHVTQRGTNRQRVFFSASHRSLYLRLVKENLKESGMRVLAYCPMTNHVHFVVIPEREDSLALLFGRANGRYAQAVNIRKGRSGHQWQGAIPFVSDVGEPFLGGLRYVEGNPCRAGMVRSAEEYAWSSAGVHLMGDRDRSGILDIAFWAMAGGREAWSELHGRDVDPEQWNELRKCTYAGRPFGEESFVEGMEERFQRKWRRTVGKTRRIAQSG